MRFLSSVFTVATLILPFTAFAQPMPPPADLIITHAHVVTMNARREIIEDGAVIIRGSRIIAVGPAALATRSARLRGLRGPRRSRSRHASRW